MQQTILQSSIAMMHTMFTVNKYHLICLPIVLEEEQSMAYSFHQMGTQGVLKDVLQSTLVSNLSSIVAHSNIKQCKSLQNLHRFEHSWNTWYQQCTNYLRMQFNFNWSTCYLLFHKLTWWWLNIVFKEELPSYQHDFTTWPNDLKLSNPKQWSSSNAGLVFTWNHTTPENQFNKQLTI